MNRPQPAAPMHFVRGQSFYQIAAAYDDRGGFIGICDGRVVARAPEAAMVADTLIRLVRPAKPVSIDSPSPCSLWR
jgi:hypothetical protein